MSRDSLRGFVHLGLLATLLQSFLRPESLGVPEVYTLATVAGIVSRVASDILERKGAEMKGGPVAKHRPFRRDPKIRRTADVVLPGMGRLSDGANPG